MKRSLLLITVLSTMGLAGTAGNDSLKATPARGPKHYISNCVYTNYYSNQKRDLNKSLQLNKQLNDYQYSEINTGFYIPFYTRDRYKKDSTVIASSHWLLVGNVLTAMPKFSGLQEQHKIYKTSLGVRYFYNNGKKNIWFFNATPLIAKDQYSTPDLKYASMLVFNRTVSERFSYRLGITKTFLLGNRLHLPIIGLRIGRLDAAYVSIMFPRNISFNFPIGGKCTGSVFIKPIGGLYDFSNRDSIYSGTDQPQILFGRYEFLNGLRLDYNPNKNFSVFLSGGVTKYNAISFASVDFQTNDRGLIAPFYLRRNMQPSLFLNWGLTVRFGKTKKVYNNMNMYDLFELNNTFDPGDNNDGPSNGDIPRRAKEKDLKKIQYKDVQDLIQLEDLY